MNVQFNFKLDEKLLTRLRNEAKQKYISVSSLMRFKLSSQLNPLEERI